MKKKTCTECLRLRREYGQWRCTEHYDWKEDNARAIKQTGRGVTK